MKHYGDITKINGAEVEAVDVITGGSPCQDLSVAGKRAGLAGERSGLFMEQIRIIKEMRAADESRNRGSNVNIRPRFMVWENVCGAFSSNNGEDFRAVLEETARVADQNAVIPRPTNGKWTPAGCIMGDGWSIAWRVHDAQFWGVPQRRKRISLVADFSGGAHPKYYLSARACQGILRRAEKRGKVLSKLLQETLEKQSAFKNVPEKPGGGKGILIQNDRTGALSTLNNQSVLSINGDKTAPLDASYYKGCGERAGIEREIVMVGGQQTVNCLTRRFSTVNVHTDGICPTLEASAGEGGNNLPMVLNDQGGSQMSVTEDQTGTLRAQEHGHQPILLESNQNHATIQTEGISTALPAAMGEGGGYVPMVVAVSQDAYDKYTENSVSATIKESGGIYGGGSETLVIQ